MKFILTFIKIKSYKNYKIKKDKIAKNFSKERQRMIFGATENPLASCEAQATVLASIKAKDEYYFTEFYNMYYQLAYEDCINGAWIS